MSNSMLNAHIAFGEPCGDGADLSTISDWGGEVLIGQVERLAREIDRDREEPLIQMLVLLDNETLPETPEEELDFILRALREVSPELDAICKRAARHEAVKRIKLENRYE